MDNPVRINPAHPDPALIRQAADIIRHGGLVAFPTETVYGLGANALDPIAVGRIFEAKQRPDWDPLIVHVTGRRMARSLARQVPSLFYDLAARFWPGPLTLIVERAPVIPDAVTAGRSTVALRMPNHPVTQALLAAANVPIAAPSANRFGRPSPTRAAHVMEDLGERVDLVLDAGATSVGVESTVLDLTRQPPALLRPGALTRETLESAIGPLQDAPDAATEAETAGQVSPGLSRRHYSPRAELETFETAADLMKRMDVLRHENRRVGVLEPTSDLGIFAHDLFDRLRRFDAKQVDYILCLLPSAEGLGLAIRDRLQRAAGRPPSSIQKP